MAIGFTPKTQLQTELNGLPPHEALALAVMAAETLGWTIIYISDAGMVAHTASKRLQWNSEFVLKLGSDTMLITSSSTGSEMWDMGKNRKVLQRFLELFQTLLASTTSDQRRSRYRDFGALLTPAEEDRLLLPPPTARERAADAFSMFRPVRGYAVTPVLLIANIIVFVLMLMNGASIMNPASDVLIRWGANFTPDTLSGGWWRLLSNVFIHIGIIHLAMNMYALLYIGAMLEPRIGSLRFGLAYLVTGIAASMTSLWWHPIILSAGASGAIFGMYGVFLAMLTTNLIEKDTRKSMLSSIGIFVGYNLLFGMRGGIDNAAHIGGLLSGMLIGYAYYPSLRRPELPQLRVTVLLAVSAVAAAGFVFAATHIHNDAVTYQHNLETFSANEARFQKMIQAPYPAEGPDYKNALNASIGIWEENLQLAEAGRAMDLPAEMKSQNRQLIRYSGLRLQELRLVLRSAEGDSSGDQELILVRRQEIQLLDSLNKQ